MSYDRSTTPIGYAFDTIPIYTVEQWDQLVKSRIEAERAVLVRKQENNAPAGFSVAPRGLLKED